MFSSSPSNNSDKSTTKVTLHKSILSGRMMKWAIELSEYGIRYKPQLSLKWKILIDFKTKLPKK